VLVQDRLRSEAMAAAAEHFGIHVESGIVRLRWPPGVRITGQLAAAAMAAVDELNGGCERPLLVEMAGTDTPSREARQQFGERSSVCRVALLGRSAVDRVRASLVPQIGHRGYPVPTRFFTSEPAAVAWLLEAESS
jgi:hypothetical protein